MPRFKLIYTITDDFEDEAAATRVAGATDILNELKRMFGSVSIHVLVESDADYLLDPNTPMEEVDKVIREAGGDPEEIAKRGVAFMKDLLGGDEEPDCVNCGSNKNYVDDTLAGRSVRVCSTCGLVAGTAVKQFHAVSSIPEAQALKAHEGWFLMESSRASDDDLARNANEVLVLAQRLPDGCRERFKALDLAKYMRAAMKTRAVPDDLQGAIDHAQQIADSYRLTVPDCDCAKEHRQLVSWLTELQARRIVQWGKV